MAYNPESLFVGREENPTIKISNELISSVLGFKCEFYSIKMNEINFESKKSNIKDTHCVKSSFRGESIYIHSINLDIFIESCLWVWLHNLGFECQLTLSFVRMCKYPYVCMGNETINKPFIESFSYPPTKENRLATILQGLESVLREINNGN